MRQSSEVWPEKEEVVHGRMMLPCLSVQVMIAPPGRRRPAAYLGECALPFEHFGARPTTRSPLAEVLRGVALALRCAARPPEVAATALSALLPLCAEDVLDRARAVIRFTPFEQEGQDAC